MDLKECREQIDRIDTEILRLFSERMEVTKDVAKYKIENGMPVLDSSRERQKLISVSEKVAPELSNYAVSLYSLMMELSRANQNRMMPHDTTIADTIDNALRNTHPVFPDHALVACQGVEGAYSQIACDKLFGLANISYCATFEDVFNAIENGLCQYGVIPVENSTAGSVNQVYDLMINHHFNIVRSVRIKVDHNLVVNEGARLEDIREIYSHPQAISQCSMFLSKLSGVKVTPVANTAVAAKMVADSGRKDVAALSSEACIRLYNLQCLKRSVQDMGNNFTRFICISKDLEIYPGADRTSLMIVLPHQQGSLYRIINRFNALGINMVKLESRPMPDRNFEFMFYFDISASVYSDSFRQLMCELNELADEFAYLGSYSEVV
ncbi:MAG: bifunctional chorismate mutase/prephenate dehydratase [Oscillospiraceae bacterium]|nr:bifunctional chorismate mutase/prephenate dehydratase [Oscillospiraceae bacterium]